MALRVNFNHNCSSHHIRSRTHNLRSCHSARAAPRRPEIDHHWNASFFDDLVELIRVYFERLGRRRLWSFAGSVVSLTVAESVELP